jgi:[ribosomal protein S5]-alanine N-acetyltransferase
MILKLKILKESDVTQSYVDWYSNQDTTSYSDNQYRLFTLDGQKNYIRSCLNNDDIDLYGIFDNGLHIGNIVITGLNSVHKRAEITYVVGNTDYWGKGVASYAISEIVKKSKTDYKLNKLYAGLAEGNVASARVLEKNGFKLEGKRLNHLFYGGEFHNQLDYGIVFSA